MVEGWVDLILTANDNTDCMSLASLALCSIVVNIGVAVVVVSLFYHFESQSINVSKCFIDSLNFQQLDRFREWIMTMYMLFSPFFAQKRKKKKKQWKKSCTHSLGVLHFFASLFHFIPTEWNSFLLFIKFELILDSIGMWNSSSATIGKLGSNKTN